ncbi:helix-turn-helix domain-containing protein [Larkinella ripae]
METPPLTFDQLPAYVYQLNGKVDQLLALLGSQPEAAATATNHWFNIDQLCDYLPSKPAITTIYGKVQRREIPFYREGRSLTFLKSEIDEWLATGRVKTKAEIRDQAEQFTESHPRKGGRRAAA